MPSDVPHLYVSTPVNSDTHAIDWRLAAFREDLLLWAQQHGVRLTRQFRPGKGTASARNGQVNDYLLHDAGYFLGMDADCLPDMPGFLHLWDAIQRPDVDLVTGWSVIYRETEKTLVPCIVGPRDETTGHYAVDTWTPNTDPGLYELKEGGFGSHCFMAKRHVFEALWEAGLMPFEDHFHVDPSDRMRRGTRSRGHDLSFCDKARELGFRIWLDNRVFWGHFKGMDIREWYERTWQLCRNIDALLPVAEALNNVLGGGAPAPMVMRASIERRMGQWSTVKCSDDPVLAALLDPTEITCGTAPRVELVNGAESVLVAAEPYDDAFDGRAVEHVEQRPGFCVARMGA